MVALSLLLLLLTNAIVEVVSSGCVEERTRVAKEASKQPANLFNFLRHLNIGEAFIYEVNMQKNEVSAYVAIETLDIVDVTWECDEMPLSFFRFSSGDVFHPKFEFPNSFDSFRVDDKRLYKPDIFNEHIARLILATNGLNKTWESWDWRTLQTGGIESTWDVLLQNRSLISTRYANDLTFKCALNMANYPHDRHDCILELNLDPIMYILNSTAIKGPDDKKKSAIHLLKKRFIPLGIEITYDGTWPPATIEIVIKFRRDPVYEIVTQLCPLFVIAAMPTITFILPADSGEKMTVSLTTVLTYFVLSISFFDQMPESENIPYIGVVFIYMIFAALVTTVAAAFVVRRESGATEELKRCKNNRRASRDALPGLNGDPPTSMIQVSKRCERLQNMNLNDIMLLFSILVNLVIPWIILIILIIPPRE